MGIAAALECLKDANVKMPGAIITGTALGCLGDTEKFLKAMIEDDEQFLTPTSFIQSIQNTVSAQIALQLNCTNHNFTFVHKGFSFESALLDAIMIINEGNATNVLAGGLDELTEHNFHIYERLSIWKKEKINSLDLFNHSSAGTIAGEGAAFFVLSNEKAGHAYAQLKGVQLIYDPASEEEIIPEINKFLNHHQTAPGELSLVILGNNGNHDNDRLYYSLEKGYFKDIPGGKFKHLCGEYQTSGAFAMWLAGVIAYNNYIPEYVCTEQSGSQKIENILIVNNYENNYALMLLSAVH